jgi:hypothetical protein
MSIQNPKTLAEWEAHIQTLEGEALRSKTVAANNARFVRSLGEEGYTGPEIEKIFAYLAKRFVETGQRLPASGYFELSKLVEGSGEK